MRLLLDSDGFCKLGAGGLLSEAAALLGMELLQCERLPALPHMLRRGRLRKRLGDSLCDRLIPLADQLPSITMAAADDIWLERLARVDAIDPGETQLFAAAASGTAVVLSGDKRALKAVAGLPDVASALADRVVVIEAVLISLSHTLGVDELRQRLTPAMAIDTAIRACFSGVDPVLGLRAYFESLAKEVAPLVLWAPKGGTG
jgi:hypothetical protein